VAHNNGIGRQRPAINHTAPDGPFAAEQDDAYRDGIVAPWVWGGEPVTADLTPRRRWTHVSAWATIGLITGLVAVAASLTGLLAVEGIAVGVISMMICLIGWRSVRRPQVIGHSLVLLGLLTAVAAIVIGVLAVTGDFAWPNHHTNEIDRLHAWLNGRWPWLEGW
jgi:lysylphosphatidylglycerol synthetase-like protein (DUF2156 family)